MKTGYKTTEFWLTAIATTLAFLASQGVLSEDQIAVVLGAAGTILAPLGYTIGRSVAKAGKGVS